MQTIAFAIPLLPGKTEDLKRAAHEATEKRQAEAEESMRRLGLTVERWYLQPTPQGDMLIVYLEGADIGRAFQTLATSQAPFDVWFKAEAKNAHGIDLSQPFPGPLPMQIFER